MNDPVNDPAADPGDPLRHWRHDTDWHPLVPGGDRHNALPTSLRALTGDVRLPATRLSANDPLLLSSPGPGRPARVLVDYGTELSGHPWHTTGPAPDGPPSVTGSGTLRAGYSESLRHAAPEGDLVIDGWRVAGNPHRREDWDPRPGRGQRQRFVQGGFRYQVLSLYGPGRVRLTGLGVHRTDCPATAADYAGYFLCDDPLLNRVWYAGAHTVQLNLLPAGADAGYWVFDEDGLDARDTFTDPDGLDHGLLRDAHWSDVRLGVRLRVERGSAGCVLRAGRDGSGLLVRLAPDGGVTLSHRVRCDAEPRPLARGRAPRPVPDGWHLLTASVYGRHAEVQLDAERVLTARVPDPTAPGGGGTGAGLGAAADGAARFRDLTVRRLSPHGAAMAAPVRVVLTSPGDADRFERPGVTERPLLLEGVKRDRLVWQGDNAVSGPALLHCDARGEYVRESLRLLASHQLPSGYIPANANPAARFPDGPDGPDGPAHSDAETLRYPSASYSLYSVLNLHDYWMHTGDLECVAELRPAMDRQLAWNASRRGPDGLLRTGAGDGMGWRYASVEGTPSYENALYAGALRRAARMYRALGAAHPAQTCERDADRVTREVLRRFRDPRTALVAMSTEAPEVTPLDSATAVVLYGLLDGDEARRTLAATRALLDTPRGLLALPLPAPAGHYPLLGPMMAGLHTWAMAEHGMTAEALDLVRRMWGPMADGDPGMTVWEVLDADGSLATPGVNGGHGGNTSLAHPWSAGPTVLLSAYVLGVRPVEPGFRRWRVAPRPGGLRRARGAVPTPYGPLRVRWARSGGGLSAEVHAPAGTGGEFVVPAELAGRPVTVDGTPASCDGPVRLDGGRPRRVDIG